MHMRCFLPYLAGFGFCLAAVGCERDLGVVRRMPEAMPGWSIHAGSCAAAPTLPVSPTPASDAEPRPVLQSQRRSDAPPPISGGTLITTQDGSLVVASDPERDQMYFLDAKHERLLFTRALQPGDEPGRISEDAKGNLHVALRGSGAIASLTREQSSPITRRSVCDLPRGLAYDAATDSLHVACAEGQLVRLPAAVNGKITRRLQLDTDLRDVMVRGDILFVTRFRSAELLSLDTEGKVVSRFKPRTRSHLESSPGPAGSCEAPTQIDVQQVPSVAWRAIDVPHGGVALLHQRARVTEVPIAPAGGYGGRQSACGPGLIRTSLTVAADTGQARTVDLQDAQLGVDVAVDPEGKWLATANAGMPDRPVSGQVMGYRLWSNPDGSAVSLSGNGFDECERSSFQLDVAEAQATALSFVSAYVLAVQSRQPASISFYDMRDKQLRTRVDLKQPTRRDDGHELFHRMTNLHMACASCHPEGGDDGLVWSFQGLGERRTQTLRGGIAGTEPFHWNGDMRDFSALTDEVFAHRMGGLPLSDTLKRSLFSYIDSLPAYALSANDPEASERGRALFESAEVGCSKCHSGAMLTDNRSADVGTGEMLQVPSLRNVSLRLPLMHNGCANTLLQRFTEECGGNAHGHTQDLDATQRGDLVAYLNTL